MYKSSHVSGISTVIEHFLSISICVLAKMLPHGRENKTIAAIAILTALFYTIVHFSSFLILSESIQYRFTKYLTNYNIQNQKQNTKHYGFM